MPGRAGEGACGWKSGHDLRRSRSSARIWDCNPVNLVQIRFRPPARNGDENGRKMNFGLTWEMGGKLPDKGKMARKWLKNRFRAICSFFGPFFPHFSGEAKIHFSAILVPISGRRPEMDLHQVHGTANLLVGVGRVTMPGATLPEALATKFASGRGCERPLLRLTCLGQQGTL